jgi:N-methylhydantoinase A/oxoprolinase/acetone carboxylase beta subunit
MSSSFRIGVDVGGTNTDAVIMCGNEVVASHKSSTSLNVFDGTLNAVTALLEKAKIDSVDIKNVMIGTTQFVNAFLERRALSPVGAIRVALPRADGIPPMCDWPDDLQSIVGGHVYEVHGGSHYTGVEYAELDEFELRKVAHELDAKQIRAVSISSSFALLRPDIEQRAAAVIQSCLPECNITLSADVGGHGLVDRESASIINASLSELSRQVVRSIVEAFRVMGIAAPVHFSQNDGTLISSRYAEQFPIFTCSAGPTNSMRGAALLTGVNDAVVIDIGGTTSDLGFLVRGFPRETATPHYLGGVRTNFRMPDVLSLPLGGGSIIQHSDGRVRIGPQSVGYRLLDKALVFGGDTLTATDIAVACGQIALGDYSRVAEVPAEIVVQAQDQIHRTIEDGIDEMRTNSKPVPVILVGGGAILIGRPLKGASEILRPEHASVANAVGAAIGLVSGRTDKLYDFEVLGRTQALDQAKQDATDAAIRAGADPTTIEIVDVVELPMTHVKSSHVQVKVRAVGVLVNTSKETLQ